MGISLNPFKKKTPPTAMVPNGVRVYAIGDIHGRAGLLETLLGKIKDDLSASSVKKTFVVFLGDYIDRGENSKKVIDTILGWKPKGVTKVALKGNHEAMMLAYLNNPALGELWFNNGGNATLLSYGISMDPKLPLASRLAAAHKDFKNKLPESHLRFFNALELNFEVGDYFFVHAGVRANRSLEDQTEEDMLWIRSEFLESRKRFEKIIVHGHSIHWEPAVTHRHISVDTGAYVTGRLTAVVLEETKVRFLNT